MRKQICPGDQRCFTLLELMVVVVVILILVSLLIPAVMESKSKAYQVFCTNNLHAAGLALSAYGIDYQMYPLVDDMVDGLQQEGFLPVDDGYDCPLTMNGLPNAYSAGYLGGHPDSVEDDDPLVVCGKHRTAGSLAVFSDTSVTDLNRRRGGDSLPVTLSQGGADAEMGVTLGSAVTITSASGQQTSLFGTDTATLVTASYDPTINNGAGGFTIVVDFDLDSGATPVSSLTASYMNFFSRFQYCTAQLMGVPATSGMSWSPGVANHLSLSQYGSYRVVHRVTGKNVRADVPGSSAVFNVTQSSLSQ